MQEKDIEAILRKVEELKSVFTFGVKFVPFLEDLLLFVQEMAPMLNEMNDSIRESSSKMPEAVQQLDKVTSATELATNEILDRVDDMLSKLDGISGHFQRINDRLEQEKRMVAELTGCVEQLLKIEKVRGQLAGVFENDEAREVGMKIKSAVDQFLAARLDDNYRHEVEQLVQDVQSDAFDIMNSLQVQDITSQQIAGAHSMLRSVQERLNRLIIKYSEAEAPELVRETRAFDANAAYAGREDRQAGADDVFEEVRQEPLSEDLELDEMSVDELLKEDEDAGTLDEIQVEASDEAILDEAGDNGSVASQDDIDALFANSDEQEAGNETPGDEAAGVTTGEDGGEAIASQGDIDALFDSAEKAEIEFDETGEVTVKDQNIVEDDAEPASQDEIDELLDWGDMPGGVDQETEAVEDTTLDDLVAGEETGVEEAGDDTEKLLDEALAGNDEAAAEEITEMAPEETVEEVPEVVEEKPLPEEQPKKKGRKAAEKEPAAGGSGADSGVSISQDEIDKLFG